MMMLDYDDGQPSPCPTIIRVDHHSRPSSWSTIILVNHRHGRPSSWSPIIVVDHHHGRPSFFFLQTRISRSYRRRQKRWGGPGGAGAPPGPLDGYMAASHLFASITFRKGVAPHQNSLCLMKDHSLCSKNNPCV